MLHRSKATIPAGITIIEADNLADFKGRMRVKAPRLLHYLCHDARLQEGMPRVGKAVYEYNEGNCGGL